MQDDDWNETAARFLREGEAVARALLRHEHEALMVLAENLKKYRVADSAKVREWLAELLPRVKD
jgi:regulator of protease activity HflC (stomatin/prohibitin superfamily)